MPKKKTPQKTDEKAKAQRRHARRRAKERLGIDLTPKILKDLLRQIRKARTVVVFRQSNRVVHHRVSIGEQTAIAVYDKGRGAIVTFLTEDMDPRTLFELGAQDFSAW